MVLKKPAKPVLHCYLCGGSLSDGRPCDKDHVPPLRWFAKELRKKYEPQFITLPTHAECQHSFEDDEVYFFNTTLPLAAGSEAADAALKDLEASFKYDPQFALGQKILAEFGTVITADGKLLKRYDASRVNRVIWKVVRGLFFVEYDGGILPENAPRTLQIIAPDEVAERLPKEFTIVRDTPSRGRYPGVFDYKYVLVEDDAQPPFRLHYWALLLWDKFLVVVAFHDPACACPKCQ